MAEEAKLNNDAAAAAAPNPPAAPVKQETPAPAAKPAADDFAFKVPEGVTVNEAVVGELKTLAKDFKLNPEQAQKVFDLGAKLLSEDETGRESRWNEVREGWRKEIKEDAEFGAAAFDANIARAQRALKSFGSDGLRSFLEDTGYGDNPEIIKFLIRVDQATGEKPSVDGKPATSIKSAAEVLFPSQK